MPGYLDGITGEYATPKAYFVDEAEAEKYDDAFPYKEKAFGTDFLIIDFRLNGYQNGSKAKVVS